MPLEGAFQTALDLSAWASFFPLAAGASPLSDADLQQQQFLIWVSRLALFLLCPGMVWLMWNSTILTERKRNAAIVAGMLRCLVSLGADIALVHAGVYHYNVDNLLYQGVPIDAHVIYGCVAGTGLCIVWDEAWPMLRPLLLAVAVGLAVTFDRWCAGPISILTPQSLNYQTYELVIQISLPVITVLFYRLIEENRALIFRSVIYALCYFAVFYFLIPSAILSANMSDVSFPEEKWQTALVAVAVLSVPGAWAAGQFAVSGRGTPLPLDPTHKLIVTGPYAYVRNPMQISCLGIAIVWAAMANSVALWIYVGVLVIALLVLRLHEEDDLHRRFGDRYKKYCRNVWLWLPRIRAYEED